MSRKSDCEKQRLRNIQKMKIMPCLEDWLSATGCPEVKVIITASRIADDVLDELEKP